MTTNHSYFEVQCALAESGQLTTIEHAELREHSEDCVHCHKRLVEVRQIGIHLFLARAFKTPSKRLPKGMQERFVARAISEGIPLSSRSRGAGFSALGVVTVLLLVLLLVAATLNDGPFTRPVLETEVAGTSGAHSSQGLPSHPLPEEVRPRRVLSRQVQFRTGASSPVSRLITPVRLSVADPEALQRRQFTFTPYSRDSGMRVYPYSAIVPMFTPTYRAPKLIFDVTSEIIRHNTPQLLAESELGASYPLGLRSGSVLAPPGLQSFHGSLELDEYRTILKTASKPNAFWLIQRAAPYPPRQ